MSEEVVLKIIEGNLAGEEFVFKEKGLCLIGRSADCALQIPKEKDMKISRRHCLLILEPPNVRIRDLGSRNGTTVNDELLDSGAISDEPDKMTPVDRILKHGDVISIGETVFVLDVPSEEIPQVIPAAKSSGLSQSPPTKVIKLTKPSPMKTGTLIPKSTPVNGGFFVPVGGNVNTGSRSIAMTEAISREDLAKKRASDIDVDTRVPAHGNKDKGQTAIIPPKKSAATVPGSLAPASSQFKNPVTQMGITAAGPLAPPPPPRKKQAAIVLSKPPKPPVAELKVEQTPAGDVPQKVVANVQKSSAIDRTEIIPPKRKSPLPPPVPPKEEQEVSAAGPKKVLKAKLVKPGSTQARTIPKKLASHMQTVVMDVKEFEEMDNLVAQPEPTVEKTVKKRVTKFRIKGPS